MRHELSDEARGARHEEEEGTHTSGLRPQASISVGLLGCGVVGGGVVATLPRKAEAVAAQIGRPLAIKRILVRHPDKPRAVPIAREWLTTDPGSILDDPAIAIVIEVIGGEEPAYGYIRRAILAGKHVVTANKEVMAKHGPELLALARERQVDIYYEASVGGGIPLIGPFKHDLTANELTGIQAIINGTTNYILTRMAREGQDFGVALAEAQRLGYAEADPTSDIEAHDAVYKLAILATLAFRQAVRPSDIYREGITRLSARDFTYARELGYAIKLLATARAHDLGIELRVHPALIPADQLIAKVDGVFNAVHVEGDLIGRMLFYGPGAGALPTTSSVVADVIALARDLTLGISNRLPLRLDGPRAFLSMDDLVTRYYLRMVVADRPGVLAQVATVFGREAISIASMIQKEVDEAAQTAEIVIMTHLAQEAAMQRALALIATLEPIVEISNFIRVESVSD